MIYVACPYWHADPAVRAARVAVASSYSAALCARGFLVFSPLSHSAAIAAARSGISESYWRRLGLHFVGLCAEVHVLGVEGWRESGGVRAEIAEAVGRRVPVRFVPPSRLQPRALDRDGADPGDSGRDGADPGDSGRDGTHPGDSGRDGWPGGIKCQ